MEIHNLNVPVDEEQVRKLRIGDTVYLNGKIYTARDMAHAIIARSLEKGEPTGVELRGGVIFHAGPVVRKTEEGWDLIAIGPTTSIRMEPYASAIAQLGVKLIIGKGGMGQSSRENFQKHIQAYLQAAPGCAVQLASGVKNIFDVRWLENGIPEAVWGLEVSHFGPLVVTMDSAGSSIYEEVKARARGVLREMYG